MPAALLVDEWQSASFKTIHFSSLSIFSARKARNEATNINILPFTQSDTKYRRGCGGTRSPTKNQKSGALRGGV